MRKTLIAVFVLAVLAVTPAVAQARVTLKTGGVELAKGAVVKLRSSNIFLEGSGLSMQCESEIEGTLSQNSNPAARLTWNWSSCLSTGGVKSEIVPTLPMALDFGEEGGAGKARFPNVTLKTVFRTSEGASLGECTYKADLNAHYEFGVEMGLVLTSPNTLTKTGGSYGLCPNTLSLTGSFNVFTGSEKAITASSESPHEGSLGLFRNSAGTRTPVFAGEELQGVNAGFVLKYPNGEKAECTSGSLTGTATSPGAQPARVKITSASFTGIGGSGNCESSGHTAKVTTNASSWTPSFEDTAGKEAKGSLGGPVRLTVNYLEFGFSVAVCTFEASSIGTTYSFEHPLGLKFNTTAMTLVESSGIAKSECKSSGELSMRELTSVTVPSASGSLPLEVIAG